MDSRSLAKLAAVACDEKKARDIKLINIRKVSSIADWIVLGEGLSDVQVKSIAKNVEDRIKLEIDILPLRKEGINQGKWALLDYGEVIIHILQPKERTYYDLEGFWSHGEIISTRSIFE